MEAPFKVGDSDTFWQGLHGDNSVYKLLKQGKSMILNIDMCKYVVEENKEE